MLVAVLLARAAQAGHVYDFLAGAVRGMELTFVERVRAFVVPLDVWRTVLTVEGCGPQAHAALVQQPWYEEIPADVRAVLREAGEEALGESLSLIPQLAAVAELAAANGIEIMALKGAARLIQGELAARSVVDIDVLAREADAERLHQLLRQSLGYEPMAGAPGPEHHHLPGLSGEGMLAVEVHTRPSRRPSRQSETIWRDARAIPVGNAQVLVPSPDALVLHTLEHALSTRARRYRLRDITDVAAVWGDDVDAEVVLASVAGNPDRFALETLLSAAHDVDPRVPMVHAGSWRRVWRVARARAAAAAVAGDTEASQRLMLAAATLAEGSPREIARLLGKALAAPGLVARTLVRAFARDPTR